MLLHIITLLFIDFDNYRIYGYIQRSFFAGC